MHLRCVGRGPTTLEVLGVVSIPIVAAFVALAVSACGAWESEALASTQQCNTACQTKMTDCILSCDGVMSCELACKTGAVDCVRSCSSDAGQPSDAARDAGSGADVRRATAGDQ